MHWLSIGEGEKFLLLFIFTIHLDNALSQNGYSLSLGTEGLAGLDASILREIAAALNPSRQLEQGETPRSASPSWSQQPIQNQPSILSGVSPSCTGKGGFFPDYSQKCRVYYRCSPTGRMARFECPLNYVFSEQLKRCDPPERVDCTGKAYESLQPQSARAILPDPGSLSASGTQARLSSGTGGLNNHANTPSSSWPPTITYNDQASGFYESLLSVVNERPENAFGRPPLIKIMGDPQITLDMDPDICYGRLNQYIPDPDTGCRGYVKCPPETGKPFDSFICPTGMRFDLKTEQCLPRGQVRCMEVERLVPPGLGLDIFARLGPTGGPSIMETPAAPRNGYIPPTPTATPCTGKTGFIPDYSQQCKVYYYCNADGTSLNLTCPAEMVFNPSLQSCDFFQTAPECKVPIPTPQKIRPAGNPTVLGRTLAGNPADESGQGGSPSLIRQNNKQQPRSLLPFLQVASSATKRPSPGVENQSKLLSPGLLVSLPENPSVFEAPVHDPSIGKPSGSKMSPQQQEPAHLEGFGQPEAVVMSSANAQKWPVNEAFSNKVNTGYQFVKDPLDQQIKVGFLPKRIGQTVPGSGAVTMYETECDGTVGFYIEPESGCRIYHFCHPNLTMETFSCPSNEVFVVRAKSCIASDVALCIDPLSSDAKDILHRNWDVPTTVSPLLNTAQLPIAQPPYLATQPSVLGPQVAAELPASSSKCTPGINGMYGDLVSQCRTYFECQIDGPLITHHCPTNLKFNTNLKACDWPEYIDSNCNEIKRTVM